MKNFARDLGRRLKRLRNECQISQMDLARLLGISRSSISAYENGSRYPDYETLVQMANYFQVSLDYLLGIDDQNAALKDNFMKVLHEINEVLHTSNLSNEKKKEVLNEVSEYFIWRLQQAKKKSLESE